MYTGQENTAIVKTRQGCGGHLEKNNNNNKKIK